MIEIYPKLYLGGQDSCTTRWEDLAVVHACKSPCHQKAVGYRGNLPSDHPHYLMRWHDFDLYLNMVDPEVPLFKVETFRYFRTFAHANFVMRGRPLLIHCNQGVSRAPSLALLLLAKELGVLPDASYAEAKEAFMPLTETLAGYRPRLGIETFMAEHWSEL